MTGSRDRTAPAATPGLRLAAVLTDRGGAGATARGAEALAGFLRDGLQGPVATAVTLVVYDDEGGRDRLVALAPTEEVRLVRVPPQRPDLTVAALAAFAAAGGADVFVFSAGPLGSEIAARLAARTGGGVATGVVAAAAGADGLTCRRSVYSGHLSGRVRLRAKPWCVALDASRDDSGAGPAAEHRVTGTAEIPADAALASPPLADVELLEPPATGDLEAARFLVVAGRGAGREGVCRIAAAAARMGAVFGATRPVVMNGWAPADRLVGVSGTRTAPVVCVTAGVHGAPALLWGIERAGFIAGVDTDDTAPIAAEADAVVIGDAAAVVEALAGLVAGSPAGETGAGSGAAPAPETAPGPETAP